MSATAHPGVVEIDLADANADANAVASRVLEVIDRARIVRVSGGSVSGSLDFIGVDAPTLLEFRNVSFSETPQFNDSRWRGLHLVGCHAPGIAIQRGVLDSLRMEECEFGGALDLDSAELRHGAGFREVRVDASSEWAIRGHMASGGRQRRVRRVDLSRNGRLSRSKHCRRAVDHGGGHWPRRRSRRSSSTPRIARGKPAAAGRCSWRGQCRTRDGQRRPRPARLAHRRLAKSARCALGEGCRKDPLRTATFG